MDMVTDAADCYKLLSVISNNARNVSEKLFFPGPIDQSISLANGEHDLNVDLGVCVRH
jgi:hypothetical protein